MDTLTRRLRNEAKSIFLAGIAAVDPEEAVRTRLSLQGDLLRAGSEQLHLAPQGKVFVVALGKAAGPMAAAVEAALGARVTKGIAVTKYGHGCSLRQIRLLEAGHPIPDAAGLAAGQAVSELLDEAAADDLVLCLISGGGSALLPAPAPGITLEEKMAVTGLLLGCGATIGEINAVRKHLSLLKGGGLARLAAPARVLTLVLSDVVGDPLDVIASGPTVPDPSTFAEALEVLTRYRCLERAPASVTRRLVEGRDGRLAETPKADAPFFARGKTLLIGSNALAVAAAAARARELGYATLVLATTLTGETRHVAAVHGALAREIVASGQPLPRPACLISGGETTVTLQGTGKGGRNQEFALAAALEIAGLPGVVVLAGGTDGTDGPTDAAGALVDGETLRRGQAAGLDPRRHLAENDAYPLFQALGDLLITGPTRTNVMDLNILLAR